MEEDVFLAGLLVIKLIGLSPQAARKQKELNLSRETTQRAQYPLMEEYTLHHDLNPLTS